MSGYGGRGYQTISTHAPAQGATFPYLWEQLNGKDFNPRSRTGSDYAASLGFYRQYISTHAPAQGATESRRRMKAAKVFQPTLPHRERPAQQGPAGGRHHFNPRSRTGSDFPAGLGQLPEWLFQPTLPHRERLSSSTAGIMASQFQPTLPHRERRVCVKIGHSTVSGDFNPRSRTGSDGALISPMDFIGLFQPTLPHRERPAQNAGDGFTVIFQPTLPHRERRVRRSGERWRWLFQPTLPHRERQQKDTKSTLSFCAIQQRIFWITFLKIY